MARKTTFFEGWSWFKFNNLGLAQVKALKFYTSVAKGLKLKKFWSLILTFVEVTGAKLVGGRSFCPALLPPILNRVNMRQPTKIIFRRILIKQSSYHRNNDQFNLFWQYEVYLCIYCLVPRVY